MIIYTHEPRLTSAVLWYAAHSSGLWAGKISCNWKQNDKDLLLLPVFSLLVISQYQAAAAVRKRFVFTLLFTDRHCCRYTFIFFTHCVPLISGAPVFVQAAGRAGQGGDGRRDQHPAHPHQHRGRGAQEHLPRRQGATAGLEQTKSRVREQGERATVNIRYRNKAREHSLPLHNQISYPHKSALRLIIASDCSTGLSAALQCCCVVSRSPRGPRPASDQNSGLDTFYDPQLAPSAETRNPNRAKQLLKYFILVITPWSNWVGVKISQTERTSLLSAIWLLCAEFAGAVQSYYHLTPALQYYFNWN